MTAQVKRFRVAADFSEFERDALDILCSSDYRPPAEQLRFLVMQEVRRRGLLEDSPAPPRNELRECAKVVETGGTSPLVQS